MNKHLNQLLISSIFIFLTNSIYTQTKFEKMVNRTISHSINEIKTDSLKNIKDTIVLLDARERNEFEVSHLKDAKYCGYNNFDESCLKGVDTNQTIVVYCSIGYRSEKIAEKLKKKGYSNVYNLYGGIFDWTNKENPVYNGQGQTQEVHAYNKVWGKWVEKAIKVYK